MDTLGPAFIERSSSLWRSKCIGIIESVSFIERSFSLRRSKCIGIIESVSFIERLSSLQRLDFYIQGSTGGSITLTVDTEPTEVLMYHATTLQDKRYVIMGLLGVYFPPVGYNLYKF